MAFIVSGKGSGQKSLKSVAQVFMCKGHRKCMDVGKCDTAPDFALELPESHKHHRKESVYYATVQHFVQTGVF